MQLSQILFNTLLCWSNLVSAFPAPFDDTNIIEIPGSSIQSRALNNRAVIPVIANIVGIVNGVELLVRTITDGIDSVKGTFTQETVARLSEEYPDWNVLVFHDESSPRSLQNAYCWHVELPLDPTAITQISFGYRVCVFEKGWFKLAGDGGYANWATAGCTMWKELGVRYLQYFSCL